MTEKITAACLRTPKAAHYMAIPKSRLTLRISAPGGGGWRLELALGSRPRPQVGKPTP